MKNRDKFLKYKPERLARKIYSIAQETINKEWAEVREPFIPQLDLFKIHHFDNKAKMTSLKKLEIALQFENVEDMPHHHSEDVVSQEQLDRILSYNLNDVAATKTFLEKTKDKIALRRGLKKRYDLDCLNYSDSKIGEQLMLKLYCANTNQSPEVVKKQRTYRSRFRFADCIPDYIKFVTPEFNALLDYLKSIEVSELKDSFKYTFEYKGFEFDLGTGGIHGCIKAGVYESNDTFQIIDADVASLYPSLAIVNNFYPQHLGNVFSQIYEKEIVEPRITAKKAGDKVMADGFKLSANSVYGKSNSEFSFLFDPLYTLKTTLAGQLSLCMLSEMLMTRIPELTMLQINTDGLTTYLPKEHTAPYMEICKEWEVITGLSLEYVDYKKMIIRDVNSYIAQSMEGKVKYKGAFKLHSEMIKDGEYYKAFNQGIVPLALSKYYIEGVEPRETIENHRNIYDFCKTFNAQGGFKPETLCIDDKGNESDIRPEQKSNRYYISKNGRKFRKIGTDKKTGEVKKIDIEATELVIIFNRFVEKPFEEYDVDFDYYVNECYKIIDIISGEKERREKEKAELLAQQRIERETKNYLEYCVNKIPTQRQYDLYKRDYLIEQYGEPKIIKESRTKDNKNKGQLEMLFDFIDNLPKVND